MLNCLWRHHCINQLNSELTGAQMCFWVSQGPFHAYCQLATASWRRIDCFKTGRPCTRILHVWAQLAHLFWAGSHSIPNELVGASYYAWSEDVRSVNAFCTLIDSFPMKVQHCGRRSTIFSREATSENEKNTFLSKFNKLKCRESDMSPS